MIFQRAILAVRAWIRSHDERLPNDEQQRRYTEARAALDALPGDEVLAQGVLAEAARGPNPNIPAGMTAGPRLLPLAALPAYAVSTILRLWPNLDPAQTVVVVDPERLISGPEAPAPAPAVPSIPTIPHLR